MVFTNDSNIRTRLVWENEIQIRASLSNYIINIYTILDLKSYIYFWIYIYIFIFSYVISQIAPTVRVYRWLIWYMTQKRFCSCRLPGWPVNKDLRLSTRDMVITAYDVLPTVTKHTFYPILTHLKLWYVFFLWYLYVLKRKKHICILRLLILRSWIGYIDCKATCKGPTYKCQHTNDSSKVKEVFAIDLISSFEKIQVIMYLQVPWIKQSILLSNACGFILWLQ